MAERDVFDFDQMKIPKFSSNMIRLGVIGIFVLIFLFSSFFTISPEEVGVILRFGKFSHVADPGLNFKIPLGVDVLEKVPVQRQLKKNLVSEQNPLAFEHGIQRPASWMNRLCSQVT